MLDTRIVWAAIDATSGLGPLKAQQVGQRFTSAGMSIAALGSMSASEIREFTGLSEGLSHALAHGLSDTTVLESVVGDERLVFPGDDSYPNGRFLSANPPLPAALWVRGRVSLLDDGARSLAVAGSRDTSQELLEVAQRIGVRGSESGWTVVSGLAVGVDSAAHQGALDGGGSTVGVMACGIDVSSRSWRPVDVDDVCFVSQFAPSEPWSGPRAMQRNATIAALSDVVVVVAAGDSGGSWEMAQLCLKRNKPLFVLDTDDPAASGNRRLIRAGATPFDAAQLDVLFAEVHEPEQTSLF